MLYLLPILAYLIGSISSAIVIARLFSLRDPRSVGSGNPGATNILRQGNRTAALLTLLGDMLKGVVPVMVGRMLTGDPAILALIGAAAFLGHVFPVYYSFQGGKGVATGLGVYLALSWPAGLSLVACWLLVAALFRYSSLAAIVTAALSPLAAGYWLGHIAFIFMALVVAAVLLWRHRDNITRLARGEEDKIRLSSR
jgi:glycerol-3-phosphate acyltransferase PlsY